MKSGIGLCGAHRVGKTTLAQAVSQASGLPFLQTHTSQIFKRHGLDPAKRMTFAARLSIQQDILSAAVEIWSLADSRFISDRTPLDMAAYTLADIQGTTKLDEAVLTAYLDDCLQHTDRFFSTLIVIPPGIPLVHEPGKAALHSGYIEHIHTLVVGLCHDPRLSARVCQLARQVLLLEDRTRQAMSFIG
jgi:hypothetical protein